jgi:gingipain K
MRKLFFVCLALIIGSTAFAQTKIQLRSTNRAECVKSDMTGFKANFSFSSLDASNVETTRGTLSEIHIEGAYPNGNVGEPQLPMFTRLIAIPTGATPVVTVGAHSETQYTLSDYGIGMVSAMQAPIRKNVEPSTVEYAFSEEAYSRDSYNDDPIAMVEVLGTMRGLTLGRLIVQPVRYNPAAGSVKVFNDIEVNVDFENGDAEATESMFQSTANVAFQNVYDQIFNIDMLMGRGSRDAYTDHPDFYNTPVKMLVICYSGFQGNAALNSWLQWKLQKGYYVDIYYTSETGTSASSIASFIKTKYNASVSAGNAYTYLIVIGDTGQVPQYMTKNIDSSIGNCASDLGYASVNFSSSTSNYFPDMYYSRISVENTTQLASYIDKVLTYEKFEFTDGGNYLNNVLLVGGWDSSWTSRVAKPTINYGSNYYFNSSNTTYGGFSGGTIHAVVSTSSSQGYSGTNHGVYDGINDGACIVNYTAHGDKQEWQVPQFTAAQAATLTNTGKYFFAIGNCCLTGNFNNTTTSYSPGSTIGTTASFGETMMRVPNAGAIAYVGCSPYSYWYEDFYWAVGAHSYSQGNYPTTSASSKGVYDVMFMDNYWNSASALLYVGNLAVQQAVNNSNTNSSITDGNCNNSAHYYFQFYHTFGDGSVMPYITKPEANSVTIPSTVTPGTSSITVNAVAGSYVAVTDNSSVIYGVAEANSSGVATVNFTESIPGSGTLYVVVTRQQYQPYFGTISIVGGTQYNITVTQPQHGTISAPAQAYANSTVTLTATPETGYCLSSWTVKKGNTNIAVTNNQFTMPEGDVTVTATFTQGMAVTLASVNHGTISADPLYALQGMTINLTATPASGYEFGSWSVYKTGDTNTTVAVNGDSFTMPNYPVTVSANFVLGPTELTVYDGTATNQYIPMYGYYFDDYTKSECIIPASSLTSMNGCTITAITFYPSSVGTRTWDGSEQTVFLKEVSGTTLGGSYSGTSGATTVKQALLEMPTAGEAYTITFDTPYTYEGGNLLIGIYNTTDGSYNKVEWYGTSNLTSGVSAYGYNGSSLSSVTYNAQSFLPKTTFTYMPASTEPVAITASANPANGGTVTGAGTYEPGTTATLTATANTGYTFANWTKNGVVMSTSPTYSFTVSVAAAYVANFTLNSYNITAAAVPAEGGTVTVGARNRDDLAYDFENGWQNWTTFQGSTTSPHSWMHNTEYVAYDSNGNQIVPECHNSSSGMMLSESYISASSSGGSGTAVTPDNYLVSPQFRLGGSFTFFAASRMSNYPAEKFSVLVSESGNNSASNFTHTELTVTLSDNSWHEYTVDLSGYSGMGYVAIRHYDCNDQHLLYIDDVTIVEGQDPSTGNGNFNYGETCTVTATPNTDYVFVNWTENGTVVSSSATYSFTVTGDRDLVANFSQTISSYTVTATANPTNGGTVTGGGTFESGQSCTLTATAATGYTFTNWTKNGTVVSTNATYTFTVNGSGDYVANFTLNSYEVTATANPTEGGSISGTGTYNHGTTATLTATAAEGYTFSNWTKNGAQVSTNATYTFTVTEAAALVANFTLNSYEVTATANPTEGGSISGTGTYNHGTTATLTATAAEGYTFTNWTKNGAQVSTNATYSFTVTEATALVANFEELPNTVEQVVSLHAGWNWWSTYLDINLAQLETLVTNHATNITSQGSGSANYNSNYNAWFGSFILDPAKMYKINASEACDLSLSAGPVDPAELEVTVNSGITWIGFPLTQAMNVNDALAGLTPEENDVIKTSGKMAMYSDGYWEGTLSTLEPGKGYVYNSRASQAKTFFYPSSKVETIKPEIGEPLFWNTTAGRYADNMNVVAVVEIDGQEALSDNIEIGAFVGNECRGSVRLSRSASTGRYLAFLTIQGTDDETVSFRVLDGDSQRPAKEVIKLRVDNVVGNVKSPFTLHVGSDELSLFPNPANRDERVHIALPASARLSGATVEVYNALGALVSSISASGTNVDLDAIHASGVYTVKVTDNKGNVSFGKLVVR